MRFEGRLIRDGKWWLAEIPLLDGMTQGRTRKEALVMIGDWLETMVGRDDFHATVFPRGRSKFEVAGSAAGGKSAGDLFARSALAWARRPGTPTPATSEARRSRPSRSSTSSSKPHHQTAIS